ncbi:Uncharacterized protein PCOAH_00005900 [Plasmodium coatneyi]|uniref:Sushi domain-containing protein n=1 Tax=Plasmodium coatneyi TaxID=208452 RepID=A0A1B1DUE2_9APIC|nr:Uncharacterized protein PCOAH_00005900 [Plasmodium coatneyi]ANQ06195.1 Uncharacterized protein PCOAH_00005900 [Plasmodium coatneyi]
MNLLCGIIIAHLLCYNVELRAKEPKGGYPLLGGQNKLESAWGGEDTMEEGLPPKDDTEEGETSQMFDEITAFEGEDGHPNLRSSFSFFQGKGGEEVEQNAQQRHEGNKQSVNVPSDHQGELHHVDTPTEVATEKIIKEGENLYINGGITEYEYNNDDEFFKSFHSENANKQIEINSPCFNIKNENACTENKNCFYDSSYQACFLNCKNLGEGECSRFTECKMTMNGCENEGYLNINVFGSDIGSDVRACELFNSEGSCYMMEELYKNFGSNKKTNFNCVWLSYKHKYRKHKKGDNGKRHKKEPREQRGIQHGGVINVNKTQGQSEPGGHPNYHVLRTDGQRNIAKDEGFLSLLELKSIEKKKKNPKNSNDGKETNKTNAKKGKTHGDDEDHYDDEDDDDSGDGLDAEEDPDFNDVNDEDVAEKEDDLDADGVDDKEGNDFDEELEKNMGKSNGKEQSNDKGGISGDGEGSETKRVDRKEPSDEAPTGESIPKGDELLVPAEKLVASPTEIVTESIIDDAGKGDKNAKHAQDGKHGEVDAGNDNPTGNGNVAGVPHERDILKHNFNISEHGDQYDEWITIETSICANLNERPNPSVLLEGALIAEKEAELRSIKNKYKITDNEICVKPSNEPNISFSPKKNFYVMGEKIEFMCQNGYKIVGTTNVGICVGRNKIVPNISCESLNDFDDAQKENIQKINSMISSGGNSALSGFLAIVLLILGAVLFQ